MRDLSSTLAHVVTEYDRQQSSKRGYNIYALAQYLGAADDAIALTVQGVELRAALLRSFNGRLLDRCLKACGLPTSTPAEQRGF
jgi:hypothetical protein